MAITTQMREQVSQLYVALFGRAPDGDGLGFWVTQMDRGTALVDIANTMYATEPARAYYPTYSTNSEIITKFYVNVLGRSPDTEGLNYWTAKLNASGATPGSVITEMVQVVMTYLGTDPAGLISAHMFQNKAAVATAYGVANGTIAGATSILSTVTQDTATKDAALAAIANGSAFGTSGEVITLDTGVNNVVGGGGNDTINGAFGSLTNIENTFNLNDVVDGGAGTGDALKLTALGTTASSISAVVRNVETISVVDTVGATLNALLFENSPAINFTNTVAGNTSTVNGASLDSVFGLAGKGNLTVDYAVTTGAADLAKVSLTSVGTSTSARSTVNVSDGNTVEKVQVATTGLNYVTLTGGTKAATVTVTGNGTNDINMDGTVAVDTFTLDASQSTGANKFRLGTALNSVDTIKGGTAADTIYATLNDGGLLAPTMSGVETAEFTYGSVVGHNLLKTSGLKTINMTDVNGLTSVINADSSLSAVNIKTMTTDLHDVTLSYRTGSEGDLHLGLGTTDVIKDADFELDTITVTRAKSFTLDVVGTHGHSAESLVINDSVNSLNFNVAASAYLDINGTEVKGSIGQVNISVADSACYSGWIGTGDTGKGNIGDVHLTVGGEAVGQLWIGQSGGFGVGNITVDAVGVCASAGMYVNADTSTGDIGNITLNATGEDAHIDFGAIASGGSIGNITANVDGYCANIGFWVSAGDWEGPGSGSSPLGYIGDVTVNLHGKDAIVSGCINVDGGDIGDVTINANGDESCVKIYLNANGESRDLDSDGNVDDWFGGGNIGNITFNLCGSNASGCLGVQSSGGNIGDLLLTANGSSAGLVFNVSANEVTYSGSPNFITVGDVTIKALNGGQVSGHIHVDGGSVGDVTVDIEGARSSGRVCIEALYASGTIGLASGYTGGGDIGNIAVTIDGNNGTEFRLCAIASGGNIGNVSWNQTGGPVSGCLDISSQYNSGGQLPGHGGVVGDVSIVLGGGTDFQANILAEVAIGKITLNAGANVSACIAISGGYAADSAENRTIGDISITAGNDSDVCFCIGAWGGDVGATSINAGNNATVCFEADGVSGDVTSVTLTGGNRFASAYIEVNANSVGLVDASTWAGELQINLAGTTIGTEIKTGTYASVVTSTDAGDTIRLGAGYDTVLLDGNTLTDIIYGFAKDKDVLNVNPATLDATVLSANAATTVDTGHILRLVDIAGGSDITTVSGLRTALKSTGEYKDVAANATGDHVLLITSTSATSTKFYVFDVVESGANTSFGDTADTITLIGVVNGDATLADLAAHNFT